MNYLKKKLSRPFKMALTDNIKIINIILRKTKVYSRIKTIDRGYVKQIFSKGHVNYHRLIE